MTIAPVAKVHDADGARCRDCSAVFNVSTCPFWSWTKSVAMHRSGSGHRISLYRIVAR